MAIIPGSLLFFWFSAFGFAGQDQTLLLGDETLLRGSGKLWIGTGGIVGAQDQGSAIRLKGKKVGVTEVRFGGKAFFVRVVKPAALRSFAALTRATGRLVGLRTAWEGAKPVVIGRLHHLRDYQDLAQAAGAGADWEMQAELSPRLRSEVEDFLARRLGAGAPVRPLLYEPGWTTLFNGTVEGAKRWTSALAPWGVSLRRDEAAVEMAPTVRVEIAVAEIRRDGARAIGLQWPKALESTLLPDGSMSRANLAFNAHAFESEGLGKILARPNILCRSGKEAEFMAGGEFPIKVFNEKMQDVIWKRYGILLRVKPKADASGRISLSIETEVSTVDPSRTVDGVPGVFTNKVASHFDLGRPRTIVLSGLLKREDSVGRQGLPGLSSLPILGALFGSREWRENRTELVVFVRPTIVREEEI